MPEQRFWRQHEHRQISRQRHKLRRHRKLERLPETDLVRQHETRTVRPAMGIEGELHKVLLMLPQPHVPAVDRRLDDRGRGIRVVAPAIEVPDRLAACETVEITNDELREFHGMWR